MPEALGLCMEDISIVCDREPETRIRGSYAVVVLLAVTHREGVFVEKADRVNDGAADEKAETVDKRDPGIQPLGSIPDQVRELIRRQTERNIVDSERAVGISEKRHVLPAGCV